MMSTVSNEPQDALQRVTNTEVGETVQLKYHVQVLRFWRSRTDGPGSAVDIKVTLPLGWMAQCLIHEEAKTAADALMLALNVSE